MNAAEISKLGSETGAVFWPVPLAGAWVEGQTQWEISALWRLGSRGGRGGSEGETGRQLKEVSKHSRQGPGAR